MTHWANTLSAVEIFEMKSEIDGFDPETTAAYLRLAMQLRLRGSLLNDETYLTALAKCPRRFWRDRAWPLLQEVLVVGEDGRIRHPAIIKIDPPMAGVAL